MLTIPAPGALLLNARTGYSHARCYARAARDCSSKLSREHWISHGVLRSFSVDGRLYISGAPWLDGAQVRLPTNALGANVLCTRHNNALSQLDMMAANLFRVLYGYQTAQADPDSLARRGTSMIGGVLRTGLGAVAPQGLLGRGSGGSAWPWR